MSPVYVLCPRNFIEPEPILTTETAPPAGLSATTASTFNEPALSSGEFMINTISPAPALEPPAVSVPSS